MPGDKRSSSTTVPPAGCATDLQVRWWTSTAWLSLGCYTSWGRGVPRPASPSITAWGRSCWCPSANRCRKVSQGQRSGVTLAEEVSHEPSGCSSLTGAPWLRLHHEDPAPSPDQMSQLQSALVLGGQEDEWRKTLVAELLLPQEFME